MSSFSSSLDCDFPEPRFSAFAIRYSAFLFFWTQESTPQCSHVFVALSVRIFRPIDVSLFLLSLSHLPFSLPRPRIRPRR